jgi:hypothetical protein
MAVGQINAALADADLLQAECLFVKGGGLLDVIRTDGDVLDLSHDYFPFVESEITPAKAQRR